jgi:hypothetical protein
MFPAPNVPDTNVPGTKVPAPNVPDTNVSGANVTEPNACLAEPNTIPAQLERVLVLPLVTA